MDPLKAYLRELPTIQPLTKYEEKDLLRQVKSQGTIRNPQPGASLKRIFLVVPIAERCSSATIDLLHLIEEGNLGLMLVLKTFPRILANTFATYAAICIESAISKAIEKPQSTSE